MKVLRLVTRTPAAFQVKKAEWLPLMDAKIRDLMVTAAAALMEGGTLVLAHEIREDMQEVLVLLQKVSSCCCLRRGGYILTEEIA